jgi:hypothetical protein
MALPHPGDPSSDVNPIWTAPRPSLRNVSSSLGELFTAHVEFDVPCGGVIAIDCACADVAASATTSAMHAAPRATARLLTSRV